MANIINAGIPYLTGELANGRARAMKRRKWQAKAGSAEEIQL